MLSFNSYLLCKNSETLRSDPLAFFLVFPRQCEIEEAGKGCWQLEMNKHLTTTYAFIQMKTTSAFEFYENSGPNN